MYTIDEGYLFWSPFESMYCLPYTYIYLHVPKEIQQM